MSITSRLVGWIHKLPPAETRDIAVERDIPVPMPDGVVLLADRHSPRGGGKPPTILIRSPYGRAKLSEILFVRPFAERGFQVLIQSCRGTYGSGGVFDPFRSDREDGLATFEWMKKQPWFSGKAGMFGASYLGFAQWAIAADAGPELQAMAVQLSASEFRSSVYEGESFWLDAALTWAYLVSIQEESILTALRAHARADRVLRPAFMHLPLRTADEVAIGKPANFLRGWLDHNEIGDAWWEPAGFHEDVPKVTAPVHLLAGWYDVFLPHTIADYTRLIQAGQAPHLTIGPWFHTSNGSMSVLLRESIAWFRAHLLGDRASLREAPVRVFVMGADEWREYAAWPPPGYEARRWHLHSGGGLSLSLSMAAPAASDPDRYRYDPADPTPAVGGSALSSNSGPKDNRALEARKDVLVYSSDPLEKDVEVIGPVQAELYVQSSLEHTDFFARLCDVDPSGRSVNVCDGLVRLAPGRSASRAGADGCVRVCIDLWPTAHRFRRGHRIRAQVSSGAHPRFARNLGSGEPLATGTTLKAAEQAVFHDPDHPSAFILPVNT